MIGKLSNYLTDCITDSISLSDSERKIYQYCFEHLLSKLFFILFSILLGLIFNAFFVSIIFLLTIIPLRSTAGGTHASSKLHCGLLSYGFFIIILATSKVYTDISPAMSGLLYLFFYIPILLISPVDTKNKRLQADQKHKLKRFGVILFVFYSILFCILWINNSNSLCFVISICVIICSISCIIGFIQNRKDCN